MNTKEKRVGTKAEIEAIKNRERRIATAIFLTVILLALCFSAYFAYTLLAQPSQNLIEPSLQFKPENPNPMLKAAIVDQLSLTVPNETFREEAAAILVKANYTVDYFSGEKVTVEFYRNLPTHGYRLIILRVHSTATWKDLTKGPVTFFTSEHYDKTKYVYELVTEQLVGVAFSAEEMTKGITYFGVRPLFVTESMTGNFQNTVIIMMGCEGTDNSLMPAAFVEKGAKAYIGWNHGVSATRTDQATIELLQHLLIQKQTIKQALTETMQEVGADPAYQSILGCYPVQAIEQPIENTP